MKTGYDILNDIRDEIMKLPVGHRLRIRYRDLRRGLANAAEEANYPHNAGSSALLTTAGLDKHTAECSRLRDVLRTSD